MPRKTRGKRKNKYDIWINPPGVVNKSPVSGLPKPPPLNPSRMPSDIWTKPTQSKSKMRHGGSVGGMGSGLGGPWSYKGKGSKHAKFYNSNKWGTNRNFKGWKKWGKSRRVRRDFFQSLMKKMYGKPPQADIAYIPPWKRKRKKRKPPSSESV